LKVAVITDQHFSARKGSKIFHDYFEKFYNDVFFPTLDEQGITHVIDMGDTFDNRKSIDFWSLDWAKKKYYDRLREMGITVWTIVGNHTAYYKNTNEINTIDLILKEYENVFPISSCSTYTIDGTPICFIPWINSENEEKTFNHIKNTPAKVAFGHLELNGFHCYRGYTQENGMSPDLFSKFQKVYSGHYHTRSDNGQIFYLGNPYELFWNDVDDDRGFHIFDTDTFEHEFIINPYKMFKVINYRDSIVEQYDYPSCSEKIIKVVVKEKKDSGLFDRFIENLNFSNCHEIKIVETVTELQDIEYDDEIEDTVSILNKYIEEYDTTLNKSTIKSILQDVYKEACEAV
jgi:hypothetical protein